MHRYRSHTCGALRESNIGETIRLSGWVHRVRDHGGVLFIDLRDHYGLTQCVVDPDSPAFALAEKLRSEFVVQVDGRARRRPVGTDNDELPTGRVEVYVDRIEVLGPAADLPLPVFGDQEYPEDIRLKYRFLDLRREKLHQNIMTRVEIIKSMRRRMEGQGFFEFNTPILTASSPEGARDFLVPSRIHPGKFYALPQAPQQYKQLLMMSGFDRYFQIAPCFRDEDPRADRLPGEFYQLDVEMSFVEQENVFETMEPVITGVFEEFAKGKPVTKVWPRMSYTAAVRAYGSDKPDLRSPLIIHDVSRIFRQSGFGIFARALESNPSVRVWAIPAPGGGSRAFCDRMDSWAKSEGQPGLAYIFWRDGEEGGAGPVAKNLGLDRTEILRRGLDGRLSEWIELPAPEMNDLGLEFFPEELADRYRQLRPVGMNPGDSVFFVLGKPGDMARFAGLARMKISDELNLMDKERFELAWIVDFPMYEYNEEDKKVDFSHNPFSMPQGGLEALETKDPLSIMAYQYDIVCNGYEIASGGIRNHVPEAMVKAFEIAGYGEQEVVERFGGMYRAFQYGAPPHGGMAAGVDRIVMLLCGTTNLREISLFPMNQQAMDLLMGAPSEATTKQLRELHVRVNLPQK
ncbi:aspartate--tRNA ligase [Bradyrhizobium sp. GCM10023182]|uniref:Aspartate--tRNA(Asp/Asn) ligase n=1 Tax=Bradyrhizobium zhengyangense TaxID=2911009 RepID=A0ABS9LH49_9BRAD|nr:aspartate--tRNA ligase [Bradyrhizobium zhengyangense]MCG2666188.1 aspartate--tRNA ligase [Bradyrhizobium zhengyangense]